MKGGRIVDQCQAAVGYPQQTDTVFCQQTVVKASFGQGQGRRPTDRGQQAVRFFPEDNVRQGWQGQRNHVGAVGSIQISGQGRGVAVYHDRLYASFFQKRTRPAGGIIKHTGLSDAGRTGSKDQHFLHGWGGHNHSL